MANEETQEGRSDMAQKEKYCVLEEKGGSNKRDMVSYCLHRITYDIST
jgi:hypothetical protein